MNLVDHHQSNSSYSLHPLLPSRSPADRLSLVLHLSARAMAEVAATTLLCEYCWNDVRGKVSCYICTTPMVPTIRCRALECIADVLLDSAHEAHETTALVGDVVKTALVGDVKFMSGIVPDGVHETRDSDETALIGDVDESRAEASDYQGGGEQSVLLETATVGVTAPVQQMALA